MFYPDDLVVCVFKSNCLGLASTEGTSTIVFFLCRKEEQKRKLYFCLPDVEVFSVGPTFCQIRVDIFCRESAKFCTGKKWLTPVWHEISQFTIMQCIFSQEDREWTKKSRQEKVALSEKCDGDFISNGQNHVLNTNYKPCCPLFKCTILLKYI